MTYCVKCGAQVTDQTRFCPQCGAAIPEGGSADGSHYGSGSEGRYTYEAGYETQAWDGDSEYFSQGEVQANKVMAVISYLGILVLVPVLAGDKSSPYLRQHVNQGFVLFIINALLELADMLIGNVILIGTVFSWVAHVVDFALLIFMIMGIVSACRGTRKPLPIIGEIHIFK